MPLTGKAVLIFPNYYLVYIFVKIDGLAIKYHLERIDKVRPS